jgi:TonB family protein
MRTTYFLAIVVAMCVSTSKPVLAISELCPVEFAIHPTGTNIEPAALFGIQLNAQGPRSVTSTIAFDTSAGWFVASLPTITLLEKDRHYDSPTVSFIQRTWISPLMYVRFPAPIGLKHTWVYEARTSGDDFGWNKMGLVNCQPRPVTTVGARPPRPGIIIEKLDPKDADHLDLPPGSGSIIVTATKSPPLKNAECAQPFADASVTRPWAPDYPALARRPAVDVTSTIKVMLNADGSLADAWVLYPTAFAPFDEAARLAAMRTKYRGAIAYCEPVPSEYVFRVTFTPDSVPH